VTSGEIRSIEGSREEDPGVSRQPEGWDGRTEPEAVASPVGVTPSRYDPGRSFERCPGPGFTFEIEVVAGEEGRELALEQARAIRELLVWVREQRTRNRKSHRPEDDGR
jgi:hypothetical protein